MPRWKMFIVTLQSYTRINSEQNLSGCSVTTNYLVDTTHKLGAVWLTFNKHLKSVRRQRAGSSLMHLSRLLLLILETDYGHDTVFVHWDSVGLSGQDRKSRIQALKQIFFYIGNMLYNCSVIIRSLFKTPKIGTHLLVVLLYLISQQTSQVLIYPFF